MDNYETPIDDEMNESTPKIAPWLSCDRTGYYGNYSIKKLVIRNGVKNIGSYAFNRCYKISSITIPESVAEIGDYALPSGANLSINISKDNPVFDNRDNCNAIIETATNTIIYGYHSTVIPDTVTAIGKSAFSGCIKNSIDLPSSVKSIGDYAFSGCTFNGTISLNEGLESIGKGAFSSCFQMKEIRNEPVNSTHPCGRQGNTYEIRSSEGVAHLLRKTDGEPCDRGGTYSRRGSGGRHRRI